MKKVIKIIFILQLVVLTIIGESLFFQHRYIELFYKNIAYVDILVSDSNSFDAFLSWAKERDVTVSRVSIGQDKEITLHLCEWAMEKELTLVKGELPQKDEFISDIETGKANQSGMLKPILPTFHFKIYRLSEPTQFEFSNLYALSSVTEEEISELASIGVVIGNYDIFDSNSLAILFSSYTNVQVILVLLFLLSSTLILFTALLQYVIQKTKDINIMVLSGFSRIKIVSSIIRELLCKKVWIGIIGVSFILFSAICFNRSYRLYCLQMIFIFGGILVFLLLLYSIIISGFVLIYLMAGKNKHSLSIKGMKPNGIVHMSNCCAKLLVSLLFIISVSFWGVLYKQVTIEKENLQSWDKAKDIYRISMNDVGQDDDLVIEVELHKKIEKLYQYLTKENKAFFMDATDIQAMEMFGVDYPLTGLVMDGYSTHITVSPNYFRFNPIATIDDMSVEQKLVYADNVLNVLVPESLSSIHKEINERFLDYFNFYRFEVYDRVYSGASNDFWNPSRQEALEINIIPVKDGQLYFTFSPDIRQTSGNKILDPVVVVYTDNVHPSTTFTKASRCLYFQYDNSQEKDINSYLTQIVEMNAFVFGQSVWSDVADRVLQLEKNYTAMVLLAIFIIAGYLVVSFSFWTNYFIRNQYSITIKSLWGFGKFRRYSSAVSASFIPTLIALLLSHIIMKSRWVRLLPVLTTWYVIVIGMFLIGLDVIYFLLLEKHLSKKSINGILKGEVS